MRFSANKFRRNVKTSDNSRWDESRIKLFIAFFFQAAVITTFAVLLSLSFVYGYDYFTRSDYFKARKIDIQGTQILSDEAVMERIGIYMGVNILSVNWFEAKNQLLEHPWISDATVERDIPDRIIITIVEEKPLAVLDLGRRFIINEDGQIFKEWESGDPSDLPVVSGLRFADINVSMMPRSAVFDAVMTVLGLGKDSESLIPNRMIRQIAVDRDMGITLYIPDDDRFKTVKLGYDDYLNKYDRMRDVLNYLKRKGIMLHIDSINLHNINRIILNAEGFTIEDLRLKIYELNRKS